MNLLDRINQLAEDKPAEPAAKPREWIENADEWRQRDDSYRRSAEWRQKRAAVLARDSWLCQHCRRQMATVVHHKTYARWMNEPLEDLMSMCRQCHEDHHKLGVKARAA